MPSYTGQGIVNTALINLGVLGQGEAPNVSDSTEALLRLNMMIEQWQIQDKFVWSVGQASYTLPSGQPSYQIGIGAAAPFNVPRPNLIQQAFISIPGPNPANPITWTLKIVSQQ